MEGSNIYQIGERIKYIRKLNNKTQIQFAEILGISQATLSEVESGKSKPMFDMLITLGLKYNVDMNWLMSNSRNDFLSTLENNEINLINIYRQLEQIAKEEILDYLEVKLKRFRKKIRG